MSAAPWWRWVWSIGKRGAGASSALFAPPAVHSNDGRATPLAGAAEIVAEPPMKPAGVLRAQPPERLFTQQRMQQAWLAIKRAGGGPGVDGVTLQKFADPNEGHLTSLRRELLAGAYKPNPVRQVLVPKPDGGLRALGIWALRDRVAQRVVYDLIAPSFEAIFLPCSFGFRPGRRVADAVEQVCVYREQNLRWILDGDIYHCFDEIDPERLLPMVKRRVQDPLLLRYIRGWLRADIWNSLDGMPQTVGVGQGSALSPLLANIYLHELDVTLTGQGYALVRYADDFVVCCRRKSDAQSAEQAAAEALRRLRLQLHPRKTNIIHLDQGMEWLGHFFLRNERHLIAR